ncbi:MAG: caspase family protein [Pseudomonadota bacterium]
MKTRTHCFQSMPAFLNKGLVLFCTFLMVIFSNPMSARTRDDTRPLKVALVIGNNNYEDKPLINPIRDAREISNALEESGFDVTLASDLDSRSMVRTINRFIQESAKADVRIFYYAGHAFQYQDRNYLLPTDTILSNELEAVLNHAISLDDFLINEFARLRGANILILDACRSNLRLATRGRGSSLGALAAVTPPKGTLVAFSTRPGRFATDGPPGKHSPFTYSLLKHLDMPDISAREMFDYVREDVSALTRNQQIPWVDASNFQGDFCFHSSRRGRC